MKVGDLVMCQRLYGHDQSRGLVVGFNKKGEGGKEYVHVLIDEVIQVFMHYDVEVIG